jgi:hypothetical protein
MVKREQLKRLAEAYLVFLITRDESGLRSFLSLDFMTRLRVTRQLRLIKSLQTVLDYGAGPEVHLWDEYVVDEEDGRVVISPLQFDVSYRNVTNPLLTETMTVTVNAVVLEDGLWKIASVLSEPDHNLLVTYSNQDHTSSVPLPGDANRKTQPKT